MHEYKCVVCDGKIEPSISSDAMKLVSGYFFGVNDPFSFREMATEGYAHISCLKGKISKEKAAFQITLSDEQVEFLQKKEGDIERYLPDGNKVVVTS